MYQKFVFPKIGCGWMLGFGEVPAVHGFMWIFLVTQNKQSLCFAKTLTSVDQGLKILKMIGDNFLSFK